ncbi:DUF4870 domain-containing protein [Sphingobacterium sp. Mn56C]|uniref:DUF4870 domain-containing protein n=1 Tax=Sphingobacterium sp. Mn56C TaxID=3395261 RepID=UPI003BE39B81
MSSKVQSILSYLGILWLVGFFAGKKERDNFSIYHLKQGFGLMVVGVVFNVIVRIVLAISETMGSLLSYAGILLLIFTILGIVNVINKVKKPLPIIGKAFENSFAFIER